MDKTGLHWPDPIKPCQLICIDLPAAHSANLLKNFSWLTIYTHRGRKEYITLGWGGHKEANEKAVLLWAHQMFSFFLRVVSAIPIVLCLDHFNLNSSGKVEEKHSRQVWLKRVDQLQALFLSSTSVRMTILPCIGCAGVCTVLSSNNHGYG